MLSSRSRRAAIAAVAALTSLAGSSGCGADTDPSCDRSFLRYDNFGSPFIVNWCRSCHSVHVPPDMRQDAPVGIDFDSVREIRLWAFQITVTTAEIDSMPPAGGPAASERQMLVEWLTCGAP